MARKPLQHPLACLWSGCPIFGIETFTSTDDLGEHVSGNHLAAFEDQDIVICQWEGCKVYNVPSSSFYWLRKHVQQAHTKERPHKCFMNGCNLSFASVEALQRHLQRHLEPLSPPPEPKSVRLGLKGHKFPQLLVRAEKLPSQLSSSSSPSGSRPPSVARGIENEDLIPPAKKPCVSLPPAVVDGFEADSAAEGSGENRLAKPLASLLSQHVQRRESGSGSGSSSTTATTQQRKRKRRLSFKVRIPRHTITFSSHVRGPTPYNGAHIHAEVLDRKTMSVVSQTAGILAQYSHQVSAKCTQYITLKAKILGRRKQPSCSEDEVLVRWVPPLADDSWIPVSQFEEIKVISFQDLSNQQLSGLASKCFGYDKFQNRKSKRKP